MLLACTPEFLDGGAQDHRIAVTADQVGCRVSPRFACPPAQHAAVGIEIAGIDNKRFGEIGQRRVLSLQIPVRFGAEHKAMRGRRRSDAATPVRVFERRRKVPSRQRLRGQTFERDMGAGSHMDREVTGGAEAHRAKSSPVAVACGRSARS